MNTSLAYISMSSFKVKFKFIHNRIMHFKENNFLCGLKFLLVHKTIEYIGKHEM